MDQNRQAEKKQIATYCPFKAPELQRVSLGSFELAALRFDQRPGMSLFSSSTLEQNIGKLAQWTRNSFLQIFYLARGKIRIKDSTGSTHEAKAGNWFLYKPSNNTIEFDFHEDSQFFWIEFDEAASRSLVGFSDSLQQNIHGPDTTYFSLQHSFPKLSEVGDEIASVSGNQPKERITIEAKTLEWLALLLDHPLFSPCKIVVSKKINREEYALNAAKRILETRLDESHTLAKISREVHLNEFKLKKGFREQFNISVFAYLRQKRMEKAYEILQENDVSVIETANAVGYSNASHFARAFKEAHGISPGQIAKLANH